MLNGLRDRQTVDGQGQPVRRQIDGASFRPVPTHVDERGFVVEVFDPRWNWSPDPLVFSYVFSVRPGFVKGWGMHKQHEDRYFMLQGEVEVVLFDDREGSPTRGLVDKYVLSHFNRGLLNIPRGVWHADHNIGLADAILINFPTIQYDHANPDKYRLPVDTDLIPYKFKRAMGG